MHFRLPWFGQFASQQGIGRSELLPLLQSLQECLQCSPHLQECVQSALLKCVDEPLPRHLALGDRESQHRLRDVEDVESSISGSDRHRAGTASSSVPEHAVPVPSTLSTHGLRALEAMHPRLMSGIEHEKFPALDESEFWPSHSSEYARAEPPAAQPSYASGIPKAEPPAHGNSTGSTAKPTTRKKKPNRLVKAKEEKTEMDRDNGLVDVRKRELPNDGEGNQETQWSWTESLFPQWARDAAEREPEPNRTRGKRGRRRARDSELGAPDCLDVD